MGLSGFPVRLAVYRAAVLGRSAAILLILLLVAGDAAVVQAVGWAGMLVERARRMDWDAAVDSTFSGAERCPMCRASAALRDERSPGQPAPEMQAGKLPAAPPAPPPVLPPASRCGEALALPAVAGAPEGFHTEPQPPPPRRA